MFRTAFVGRSRELETLDRLWAASRATFLILYGRRRVGKTRLLAHWLEAHAADGFYWVAEPASPLSQLRSFSQALMAFMDPEAEIPADFTFASWDLALRQLATFSQGRRVALFIDEVTYLIDSDPKFVGMLQKVWDRWLGNANVMLAMAGSQMALMRKHLLDYDAPLYGRATATMELLALPYGTMIEYFPNYSAADRVAIFGIWGGVPAYWERLEPTQPVLENLRQIILPANAWMVDESRILLQDFITDLHHYVGVMRAIAGGQQAMGFISKRTGLSGSKVSFYLSVLRDTGFVVREIPVTQLGTDSRRGRYRVTDPYLRFFYRYISANQSKLALGQYEPVMELIAESLPDFIEANTWRELCREWVLRASAKKEIPVQVDEIGGEWTRNFEIDVAGINMADRSLVLGSCFWRETPMTPEAIVDLAQNINTMLPKDNEVWRVYVTMFSANGWTDEAREQARRLLADAAAGRGRRRWISLGIRLLDLATVDADLAQWSL
ncbi:MAG: ATP-binding protein [Anaerolineales bacterium]|nr:ATP-binding protein [Anaerolineales bacterium]